MHQKGVLWLLLLFIEAIPESEQVTTNSDAVNNGKLEEGEPLVGAIFELFRHELEVGAGPQSKRLENNELLLIRGAKFRTRQDLTLSMYVKYNYSDFHFFGSTIPSDFSLYLLVDESNKKPNEQLQSVTLGRCKYGRPPGNANGQGVESVLSATDKELENWLAANEDTSNVSNKMCDHSAKLTTRVMNFSEWGTHILSNYTLFEWSNQRKPDGSRPPSYIYLRGVNQRITKYSEYFGADLFKIKQIKDVWLIATNRRLNFSFSLTSDDKAEPFVNSNDANCHTGPQVEKDTDGNVQYVNKVSLSAAALQLFAEPNGEVLMAPRGELCVKSCAPAPLRPAEWFDKLETRCPNTKYTGADIHARHNRSDSAGSASRTGLMMNLLMNALNRFGRLGYAEGMIANEGNEWLNSMNSVTLQEDVDGQFGRRACLPLEARYEPMVFSHHRHHQRNLYYRFDVMPLGANRCCCF